MMENKENMMMENKENMTENMMMENKEKNKENMMLKEHMGKLQMETMGRVLMESMGRVLMERMEKEKKCKYLSNSSEILHIYFKLDSIFCCEPSRPMQVQFSLRAHYMTFYDFWILRTFLDLGG